MVNASSLKQGYLHIKRERASSPVATRVLFKPWQQAYFVLRKDDRILEEYKDASLKTQRQIHFIAPVKHVGPVRTSKSKQYAFEVVMSEKTHLLLACDNEILLNEWIAAFSMVMNGVSAEMNERKASRGQANIYDCERKRTQYDKYDVEVIETTLSEANDLHGMYVLCLSASRFLLTDFHEIGKEVLSWPFTHVTSYNNQTTENYVIFTMGRNCHFGCGKLIFRANDHEEIVNFIKHYIPMKQATLLSSSFINHENSLTHEFLQSSDSVFTSMSSTSTTSTHVTESISFDENKPVFDSPQLEKRDIVTVIHTHEADEVEEEENNNLPQSLNYEKVKQDFPTPTVEDTVGVKFPEISNEECYILPNEEQIDEKWRRTHSNFTRFSCDRVHVHRSRNNSDENETATTYLQLTEEDDDTYRDDDNDDDGEKDEEFLMTRKVLSSPLSSPSFTTLEHKCDNVDNMEKLLQTITLSLENPTCDSKNVLAPFFPKSSNAGAVQESRRASEPCTVSVNSSSPRTKLRRMRATQSQDSTIPAIAEHPNKTQSPSIAPQLFKVHEEAFPKQHSVTHTKHGMGHFFPSSNPFNKADSFFTRPMSQPQLSNVVPQQKTSCVFGMKRNLTTPSLPTPKTPELDRKRKPKAFSLNEKICKPISRQLELATSIDNPPPVPERTSPKTIKSPISSHKVLKRTNNTENDDSDNKSRRGSDSSDSNSSVKSVGENETKTSAPELPHKVQESSIHLVPPPLPPKSNLLSSTKSAPLHTSNDEIDESPTPRRRSYAFENTRNEEKTEKDSPPEIPSREPKLYKAQKSTGNLLEVTNHYAHSTPPRSPYRTPPKTPPKTPPRTPPRKLSPIPLATNACLLSQSLDSSRLTKLLSVKVTNYEEEITVRKMRSTTLTDPSIGKGLGLLPRSLTNSGRLFPDSPQKFF